MDTIIQFFVQSYTDKFTTISMEEIYLSARENLLLLENLLYISLGFFLCLLLFYVFHFRLKKPVLTRRIIIIFIMIIMGVGWPMTLYSTLIHNITPAVLLLGCFTLLVMNVYLFFVYWVNPFSPSAPWKYGYKIWTGLALGIMCFNLFSIIFASLAQGAVMAQAVQAKLLADQMMVTAESLSADLDRSVTNEPSVSR